MEGKTENLLHKHTCHRDFLGPFQVSASNSPDRAISLPCQHMHQLSTDLMDLHPILSFFRETLLGRKCFLLATSQCLPLYIWFKEQPTRPTPALLDFKDYLLLKSGNKNSLSVNTASDTTQAVLHHLPTPIRLCDNSSILQLCAFLLLSNNFADSICQPGSLISTWQIATYLLLQTK